MKKKYDENNNEFDPYEIDKLSKVPSWLIVIFLKYWAAAAAVFFIAVGGVDIGFGVTEESTDPYAQMAQTIMWVIMIGLALALFTNYVVRPIVRLMYNRRNNTFRYNMVNCKGFKSFLLVLPYMLIITAFMPYVLTILSHFHLVFDPFGVSGGVGIEPLTFGLWFTLIDLLCILVKNIIIMLYQRYKYFKLVRSE